MTETRSYFNEVWEILDLDNDDIGKGAIMALTGVNGLTIKTINDFIYWYVGYRDLEQLKKYYEEGLS